jgi:hypothetical protein
LGPFANLASLAFFKTRLLVDEWRRQYDTQRFGKQLRFKKLLLFGKNRSGRTQFGKSLFGDEHTLVLNCQGQGSAIPSLREVDRSQHKCVLFDEINEQQVVQNKALCLAGFDKIQLGQSPLCLLCVPKCHVCTVACAQGRTSYTCKPALPRACSCLLAVAYWQLLIGSCLLAGAYWQWPIGSCLLAVAFWKLPTCSCLLAVAYWQLLIGSCLLAGAYWLLPIGSCLLAVAFWELPTCSCLLADACWQSPAV